MLAVPTVALAVVLVACSADGSAGTSSAGDEPAAVCASADALEASVADLGQVQVAQDGILALQDAVASVGDDMRQVKADATAQYATQVDQLQTAVDAVRSAVRAAVDAPTQDTLTEGRSSIDALADEVTGFADDVGSTC
jgi:phage host-nuclease inhibitor protein Gam